MTWCRTLVLGPACFVVAVLAFADASAQTKDIQVKPVIVAPFTDVDGKEMVVLNLIIAPGAASPIHTHPGDCVGMVTEGTVELLVQGKRRCAPPLSRAT
jgi:quercetin dioxygenase-like cupin family protein